MLRGWGEVFGLGYGKKNPTNHMLLVCRSVIASLAIASILPLTVFAFTFPLPLLVRRPPPSPTLLAMSGSGGGGQRYFASHIGLGRKLNLMLYCMAIRESQLIWDRSSELDLRC